MARDFRVWRTSKDGAALLQIRKGVSGASINEKLTGITVNGPIL